MTKRTIYYFALEDRECYSYHRSFRQAFFEFTARCSKNKMKRNFELRASGIESQHLTAKEVWKVAETVGLAKGRKVNWLAKEPDLKLVVKTIQSRIRQSTVKE